MTDQPEKAGKTCDGSGWVSGDLETIIAELRDAGFEIVRAAEIARLRAQRDQLLAALNLVMVGGNHLASVLIGRLGGDFSTKYPPDLDHEIALQMLGATDTYDVWCCWAAIMTARAVANQDANSKVKG